MITIKAIFEDGNSIITDINTDFSGAVAYYLGHVFNLGVEDDNIKKCIAIEELI